MDVIEQLTMALNSQPSSDTQPDPEQFLAGFLSSIGIARGAADSSAAKAAGLLQSAGFEEDIREVGRTAPTREDLLEELWVLLPIALTEKNNEKGGTYRRIAEIVEQVDDEKSASVWWLHAAQAGDEVASAIVEDLDLDLSVERPSVQQSIHQIQIRIPELKAPSRG